MALTIPVNIRFNVPRNQLNGLQSQINNIVNNRGLTSDIFAPLTRSAQNFASNLVGINGNVLKLTNSFNSLKTVALGALSFTALKSLGADLLEFSSDLREVQNVVDTTFGDMADDINEFSQNALKTFGLTELQAKKYSSTIGAITKATGLSADATLEMSKGLTKMTADLASFRNLDFETSFNKLRAGLTGETEPLRAVGIVITQTNLEAYRLKKGIETSYTAMDEASKMALRYNFILDNLKDAQGDFNKTQSSWANQTRILQGQFEQLQSVLGGLLQKVLYPLLTVLNQLLEKAIQTSSALAKLFGFDAEALDKLQGGSGDGAGIVASADAMEDLADNTDDATKAQKKLTKEQNKQLSNVHKLNLINKKQAKETATAASKAKKTSGIGAGINLSDYAKVADKSKGEAAKNIENFFKTIKDMIDKQDWVGLGKFLADGVNSIFKDVDLTKYYDKIKNGVKAIATVLNSFTSEIDFANIGRILGEGINLILYAINSFFDTYDFANLGYKLAQGLNSLQDTVDWSALGQTLINKINAVFSLLAGFVKEFNFADLGSNLATMLTSAFKNLKVDDITDAISGLVNGIVEALHSFLLTADWETIGNTIKKLLGDTIKKIKWGKIWDTIVDFHKILPKISKLLDAFLLLKGVSVLIPIFTNLRNAINMMSPAFALLSTFIGNIQLVIHGVFVMGDTLSTAMAGAFGGIATTLTGIGSIIAGALLAITNFFSMLKDGFSWVKEVLMVLGVAIAAVGAVILGAPALVAGIVAAIVATLSTLIVVVKDNWESIKGFLSNLGSKLVEVGKAIAQFVLKAVTSFLDFRAKVQNAIATIIKDVLSKLINGFIDMATKIGEALGKAIEKVASFFTNLKTKITDGITSAYTSLTTKLQSIIDWIKTTFTTSWENVWNGLGSKIGGAFTSGLQGVKDIINGMIDMINKMIEGVNKISFDSPDWLPGGSKHYGINIPELPHLANGGVIPPRHEFAAVLGDQRSGMNIETPLSTMIDAFKSALSSGDYGSIGDITIPIYVNNELTTTELIRKRDVANYRSNGKH